MTSDLILPEETNVSVCHGHPVGRTWALRHWGNCRVARIPTWNVRLGRWSRIFAPAHSVCAHCRTPWRFVQPRDVPYSDSRSQFALCVKCWDEATTVDRLRAHMAVTCMWESPSRVWPDVEAAVLAESTRIEE